MNQSLTQENKEAFFHKWKDVTDYLNTICPNNKGIFVYGSILFEPITAINDIDLVILTSSECRQRIVKQWSGQELHINLLSKNIFLDDLYNGTYGEFYVNKIMNPYRFLKETEPLVEIFMTAKKIKVLQALKLFNKTQTRFSIMDMVKLITCIRIFQFPHYLSPATSMFSNNTSDFFATFISEYLNVLSMLVKDKVLIQIESEEFIYIQDQSCNKWMDTWITSCRIIPLYWNTFKELHKGKSKIKTYLEKHINKLALKYKQGVDCKHFELFSKFLIDYINNI